MKSVSIVCTNYNKGDAVAEAIESFLIQQTTFPVEILVVDDASTDGSREIIRYYCENYPDRITGVFKETNEGIGATWREACKIALGDYIACCDADDYWIDPFKLQKQVDLLESLPDSEWSNTDFDMKFTDGRYIKGAFEQEIVPFVDSFEDMLVKQAMTMASTWVVDAALMRKANEAIRSYSTDDTFDIQLELFKHTKLAYLPESTTVYRLSDESDSRSCDLERLKNRINGLRDVQLDYIDSEDWLDYKELSKKFARWYAEHEAIRTKQHLDHLAKEQADLEQHKRDEARIRALENEIVELKESNSWKLTAPLRKVGDMLERQDVDTQEQQGTFS